VAWPIILGFALWESVGDRGSRGVVAGAAAIAGAVAGFVAFGVPTEYMPVTDLSLGIVSGVLVGVMVVIGVLARDRFPVSGMLIGFAAFFGVFEPLWRQSPANFRTHGLENLTVVWLGLLVGVLSAAVVRAITDSTKQWVPALRARAKTEEADEEAAPLSDMLKGGATE